MRTTMRSILWVGPRLWISAAALVAVTACAPADGEETSAPESDGQGAEGARIINVEVTRVTLTDFIVFVRVTGEVEALHDVTVAAEESGPITQIYVVKGRWVAKDAAIMKIDDEVLAANVDEARALLEIADEQFERQRQLWEDEGIGSEIAFLQARAAANAARARLRTLQARLARTTIRAPVSGVFDDHFLDLGEMASPGTPAARIVSVGQVKVVGGVPERYALSVQHGDSARISLDAFPGREFPGTISYVGASVDERARTVPIEILLANPDRALKPRMVANVQLELDRLQEVIVVPQDVVVRTETGYQVFLAGEVDGRAVALARDVTLGQSSANRVVIASGLVEGDTLITLGHRMVDDQSRIRIVSSGGTS